MQIAMAFVPSREAFLDRLGASEELTMQQIGQFVQQFGGIVKILEDWLVRLQSAVMACAGFT